MEIFNSVDRKDGEKTKPIASTYPVYYFREHIDSLREETESLQRRIDSGLIPPQYIATHKEELKQKSEKLERIEQAKPELSTKEKDTLDRFISDIGGELSRLMPTYTDMQKGLASPQDEVRMMHKDGCADIKGYKGLVRDMGITPRKNGKITRNDAAKAWKIACSLRDRPTNVERLRKDHIGHSYKVEPTLEQMERDG